MASLKWWEQLNKTQKSSALKAIKGTKTIEHKSSRSVYYLVNGKKVEKYFDKILLSQMVNGN